MKRYQCGPPTLCVLCAGERPVRGQLRMPAVPDECPQAVADLLMECLSLEPTARPSAQQLLRRLETLQDP
jgi:RecB family endonuclease NucS